MILVSVMSKLLDNEMNDAVGLQKVFNTSFYEFFRDILPSRNPK